jgi:hypothetical protein
MMNNVNWVQTSDLNLNLLTCGSDDLTYEENINIIKHVFNFIKSSKRFLKNDHISAFGRTHQVEWVKGRALDLVYDDCIC